MKAAMTPGRASTMWTLTTALRKRRSALIGWLAMALLLCLTTTALAAEMVTDGGFPSATNWALSGTNAPVWNTTQNHGTLAGAGSLSQNIINKLNANYLGRATQTVNIASGATIANKATDIDFWAMHNFTSSASTGTIKIYLRYADASEVEIFSGTLSNSAWTNTITNNTATVFPLTTTQDVNSIIVELQNTTASKANANLYFDDLTILYTASAADSLTVSRKTSVSTTAEPGEAGVQMEWLKLFSNNTGNGQVVLTSATVQFAAWDTADPPNPVSTAGKFTSVTVAVDNDYNYVNGTLGSVTAPWEADDSVVVDLTSIAAANRTVTAGTPTYLWIIYNLAGAGTGYKVTSDVTAIGVLTPDNPPIKGAADWASNYVYVTVGMGCAGCHPTPPTDGASRNRLTGATLGSHRVHADVPGNGGYDYACSVCHLAEPTVPNHRNNNIEMTGTINGVTTAKYDRNADHVADTSWPQTPTPTLGKCENSNCHGGNNTATNYGGPTGAGPTWGTAHTSNCTFCHNKAKTDSGVAADAYPTATSLFRTANAAGAHATHLTVTSNLMNGGVVCADCHSVPGTVGAAGHLDAPPTNNIADLTWGADAQLNTTTPSYAAGSCTVYCHGANTPGGDAGAFDATPAWTADWTTYVPGTAGTCSNYCHGLPPTSTAHNSQAFPTSCTSCHQDTVTSTANPPAIAVGFHMNGTVEASGGNCDGCHGYPPSTSDGKAYQAVEGKGAHPKHVTHLQNRTGLTLDAANDLYGDAKVIALCGVCHDMNAATHETGGGTRNINFNGSAGYQFGSTAISYNGTQGQGSAVDPKNCSNVRCHYSTTPVWE